MIRFEYHLDLVWMSLPHLSVVNKMVRSSEEKAGLTDNIPDSNHFPLEDNLETPAVELERSQREQFNPPIKAQTISPYTLAFRVVVGLFFVVLLFVAAIYYGVINP
jgi:hypothetical protein